MSLHGVVRRGVELVDVQGATLVERAARFAFVAGLGAVGREAVDRLGEDSGAGGLAYAAGAAEEVGVGQLAALDGVLKRRGDVLLSDDRAECRRAVFACADDEITHDDAKIKIIFAYSGRTAYICRNSSRRSDGIPRAPAPEVRFCRAMWRMDFRRRGAGGVFGDV